MQLTFLKTKIHRATVTKADLNYEGSISIDQNLLEASGIYPYEKVDVLDINNGERFITYAIKGERKSGDIILNGPAARKVAKDDIIIIIAYAMLEFEEAKLFKPSIVFPNEKDNSLT